MLEGALIPAAYHPNYMVVSQGNEKIRGLKIFPAIAVNKALNIVKRRKLFARVVAVQTIDDLRQQLAPRAHDVATRSQCWLAAAQVDARTVEDAKVVICRQARTRGSNCPQGCLIVLENNRAVEFDSAIAVQLT